MILPRKVYNKCGGDRVINMTIEQQILKRIDKEKKGYIFINADFLDLAE